MLPSGSADAHACAVRSPVKPHRCHDRDDEMAAPTLVATGATKRRLLGSISFSGAGFLGCYHMGAASALLGQGYLVRPGDCPSVDGQEDASYPALKSPPILTGVSAGSIVSAALSAGVRPDDGMDTLLQIAKRTREKGGALDVLKPGFSLVDQVEDLLLLSMKRALGGTGERASDYDKELWTKRIAGGKLLRIGLTDYRLFTPAGVARDIPEAYRYVDQYRDVDDAVAVCILSSYIPGATGTLRGAQCPMNESVRNSWARVFMMEQLGYVKDGKTGKPVVKAAEPVSDEPGDLHYWDGGLADVFPTIDDDTLIVSPINGHYTNPSISPSVSEQVDQQSSTEVGGDRTVGSALNDETAAPKTEQDLTSTILQRAMDMIPKTVQGHARASFGLNAQNAETIRRMMWSSDDAVLQERFRSGYDDAMRFLREKDLLTTYRG